MLHMIHITKIYSKYNNVFLQAQRTLCVSCAGRHLVRETQWKRTSLFIQVRVTEILHRVWFNYTKTVKYLLSSVLFLQLERRFLALSVTRSMWRSICFRNTCSWPMRRWRLRAVTCAAPKSPHVPQWTATCAANTPRWETTTRRQG